jgi:redox-sensitive bicupin YhaK (pirin superfamily)
VQVIRGELDVNGTRLSAGDGAAVEGEKSLTLNPASESEVLVFDLSE